jgi:hypothetical protein
MPKKKRTSKTSKGLNRGAKRLNPPLTEVQKVLMRKGMLVNVKGVQA